VITITSSPASLKVLIRDSNLFFIPLIWLKGLGSTNNATFLGVYVADADSAAVADADAVMRCIW
jgi:hypothetical protein